MDLSVEDARKTDGKINELIFVPAERTVEERKLEKNVK